MMEELGRTTMMLMKSSKSRPQTQKYFFHHNQQELSVSILVEALGVSTGRVSESQLGEAHDWGESQLGLTTSTSPACHFEIVLGW
jgi:hypothetical protein